MKLAIIIGAVFCGSLLLGGVARGEEPTTKPAKDVKLTAPWSKLTTLTPEQKQKIKDIHDEAKGELKPLQEQEKQIRSKERADIEATLTDEQKKELADLEVSQKEHHHSAPATMPAAPATMP